MDIITRHGNYGNKRIRPHILDRVDVIPPYGGGTRALAPRFNLLLAITWVKFPDARNKFSDDYFWKARPGDEGREDGAECLYRGGICNLPPNPLPNGMGSDAVSERPAAGGRWAMMVGGCKVVQVQCTSSAARGFGAKIQFLGDNGGKAPGCPLLSFLRHSNSAL